VFNGEIYNYKQLRTSLLEKWEFHTNGDTEVLLAGLIIHGPKFLNSLKGMWAFALWDNAEKALLLSRDRFGKKPLFYHNNNESFYCASEIPALSELTKCTWSEDLNSTADYFRFGYCMPGNTFYTGIKEVLPAHIVRWHPNKGIQQEPFWKLRSSHKILDKNSAVLNIKTSLIKAVENRLVADVEVGSFLSGGIDSSIIVAILNRDFGITPKSFTIGFENKSYDEREYAHQVSKLFHTRHYEKVLSLESPLNLLDLVVNHMGQPYSDASLLPTALVSKLASEHVKVVLSGDGADEVFSGYQRYQARTILRWYLQLPSPLRKYAFTFFQRFSTPSAHHSRSLLKKANLFMEIAQTAENEVYFGPRYFSDVMLSQIAPEIANRGNKPPSIPEANSEDEIHEMMMRDMHVYLPQDILTKVDRASMAYSLEVRTPFLDTDVVELAFSLPRVWHRSRFCGKKMLRLAFRDYLPNQIWSRRKQGFAVPLADWFRNKLGNELEKLVTNPPLALNSSYINTLLTQHRSHKFDHSLRLWNVYVYLKWKNTQSI
jgi:asparagine synthase (glutamine-hydrolysing)